MRRHVFAVTVFMLSIGLLHAATIYVPDNYSTIQAAINASTNGDTVIVRPGIYVENVSFIGKAITVMSELGAAVTTIDGNQANPVVIFNNGEGKDSKIVGFTVTNGKAPQDGGGIYCYFSSPSIMENTICGNTASSGNGGGIYCRGSGHSPSVANNTMCITNNTISGNTANDEGGGVYCQECAPDISYNEVTGNMATSFGGGICSRTGASATITNNIIAGNMTLLEGGGIFCGGSSPDLTIAYNIIWKNTANTRGGGIYCEGSPLTIMNNTITENKANESGGAIGCIDNASPVIVNGILWNNTAPIGKEIWVGDILDPSTLTIKYSDVEGGQTLAYVDTGCTLDWGLGMIDADPLFVNPINGDFHLQAGSPCIDTGDPNSPLDPDGTRADMGALYFDQTGPNPDLVVTHMTFFPSSVNPNTDVTITYTIENVGDLPCGAGSLIGFYLSEDDIIDLDDYWLGDDAVPDLNPGDIYTNTPLPINVGSTPGNWYIGGYADWTVDVSERNESNNSYTAGQLTINSLWSDVTTISRSAGGQVIFDLQPGTGYERRQYFLLGSVSGTSPGTILPGGNSIPLNKDLFFNYILNYFNFPPFGDFRGWFGFDGQAVATFDLQPDQLPSSWIGTYMNFAFTTEHPYDFQSNPVEVKIVP